MVGNIAAHRQTQYWRVLHADKQAAGEIVMGTTAALGKLRKVTLAGAEGMPLDYSIFSWRINSTCQGSLLILLVLGPG